MRIEVMPVDSSDDDDEIGQQHSTKLFTIAERHRMFIFLGILTVEVAILGLALW